MLWTTPVGSMSASWSSVSHDDPVGATTVKRLQYRNVEREIFPGEQGIQYMISRIEINGFRAIRSSAVNLNAFQVLVGPNASGKSTFFDVLAFVRPNLSDSGG
jgi:translation initiation factor RLI1